MWSGVLLRIGLIIMVRAEQGAEARKECPFSAPAPETHPRKHIDPTPLVFLYIVGSNSQSYLK